MHDDQPALEDDDAEIFQFLAARGHSDIEVQKIMLRIKHYENNMQIASVMDSIGDGTLNLAGIIAEALSGDAPQ
jgi:hypothetical protein